VFRDACASLRRPLCDQEGRRSHDLRRRVDARDYVPGDNSGIEILWVEPEALAVGVAIEQLSKALRPGVSRPPGEATGLHRKPDVLVSA
jgi:hypothetical protein